VTGALQALLSAGIAQPRVDISDMSAFKSARDPATATTSYALSNSGQVFKNGIAQPSPWLLLGGAGDYDVRATQLDGTSTIGGILGSWENLASTLSWSITASGAGDSESGSMFVEIRDALTLAMLDSATISFSATVLDPGGGGGGGGP
jgi:hypothetical protein